MPHKCKRLEITLLNFLFLFCVFFFNNGTKRCLHRALCIRFIMSALCFCKRMNRLSDMIFIWPLTYVATIALPCLMGEFRAAHLLTRCKVVLSSTCIFH